MAANDKNRGRTLVVGLAVALIGASALTATLLSAQKGRATGPTAAAGAEADPAVAELRDEVRGLKRQLAQVAGAQAVVTAPVLEAREPAAPAKKLTEEETRQKEREHSLHIATYSTAYFEREGRDSVWSVQREKEIQESLGDLGQKLAGFSLGKADCRTTICRTVVNHTETADTQAFGRLISETEPFRKMGAFFHYEADKVILFSPREGHAYPPDPTLAQREND
jgi:hypothetical protein